VGLLAAFLVACAPVHLTLSGLFKPDILAVTTVLLAFLWSLNAVDRPTIVRYLVAGLGIGLAISSKPTVATIAIPLTLGALLLGVKDRRHWLGLALAGVTSVAIVVSLNPYVRYLKAMEGNRRRYAAVAAGKGTLDDPVELVRQLLAMIFAWPHGVWLGLAAAAGLVLLAVRVWRRRSNRQAALREAMLLIFPLSFAVLYCLATRNLKPNNLAPLLPFTSLTAALLLLTAWGAAKRRIRWLADWRLAAIPLAGLALLASNRVHAKAYGNLIPTTGDRALEALAAEKTPAGTWIRWEAEGSAPKRPALEPGPPKAPPRGVMLWKSSHLTEVANGGLDLSDAEVFPLVRTLGQSSEFYEARMESPGHTVRVIEPALFRAWGPALVIVQHDWHPGRPETVSLTRTNVADWFEHSIVSTASSPEVVAIEFFYQRRRGDKGVRVEADGRPTELRRKPPRRMRTLTTERVSLAPEGAVTFRIRLPESVQTKHLEVVVRRWTREPDPGRPGANARTRGYAGDPSRTATASDPRRR